MSAARMTRTHRTRRGATLVAIVVGLIGLSACGTPGGPHTSDRALDTIAGLLEGGMFSAGDPATTPNEALCTGTRVLGASAGTPRLIQGLMGNTLVSIRVYRFASTAAARREYTRAQRELAQCDGRARVSKLAGPGTVHITERDDVDGRLRALFATEFPKDADLRPSGLWSPLEMWVHYSVVEDLLVITYAFNTDPREDVHGASLVIGEAAHRQARLAAWSVLTPTLGVAEIPSDALRSATAQFLRTVYPTRQVQVQCPPEGLQQGAMVTCQADVDGYQVTLVAHDAQAQGRADGLVFEQLSVGITRAAADAAARAMGALTPECGLPEWGTVTLPYVVRCQDPTGEYRFAVAVDPSTQRPVLGTLRADSPSSTP